MVYENNQVLVYILRSNVTLLKLHSETLSLLKLVRIKLLKLKKNDFSNTYIPFRIDLCENVPRSVQ